ncbi:MAG TPA: alpha/beta hydrolase-fold protein [Terriglobales bacterium]|nr:alpha/beta hydrolase-fold protein [Terriglobales bacterium]
MYKYLVALFLPLALSGLLPGQARIEVTFPASQSSTPLNGRVFFYVAKAEPAGTPAPRRRGGAAEEPRFEIGDQVGSQQFFGLDVTNWKAGTPAVFDASIYGYPLTSLRDLPAGDYTVQALFNRYTTFHRADGHTLLLPRDEGEGQQMTIKPGNLYSAPQAVHFDPRAGGVLRISLTEKIPPIQPPPDTAWIKHIKIQSRLLTQFWGQPMFLNATVVLPEGFAEHPNAHYPVMVEQNHFNPDLARAFHRIESDWTSGKLPKFLWVDINHANPYYDDSYAVNSANLGPYGDAITQELIPAVERQFRGIGQGWARTDYGCSTGGWEALADQIFYPDYFNGAWGSSPDPVDFHAHQIVDIYKDANAYWLEGPWSNVPRPDERRPDGTVTQTMDRANHRELVLGTHGRSADQWDIWQAVFGPVGADGYPANIWDPLTGAIDHTVARYWHDHYDLDAWLDSHWATLAPKLDGKLHVHVGDMDSYYLDNAVYMMQATVEKHSDPKINADFDFGRKQPHCYDGTYGKMSEEQLYMPQMLDRILKTAPAGADLSWNYQH